MLPAEGVTLDLIQFWGLIERNEFLEAAVHAGECDRGHCAIMLERIDRLLASNTHYGLELMRALLVCREDVALLRRGIEPPR